MLTRYAKSDEAWRDVVTFISNLMERQGARNVLEVGAGANPAFPIEFVKRNNLKYTLLDISIEELAKAPTGYITIHADISDPNLNLDNKYDFVFSRMLAEHVKSGEIFHRNVFRLLVPGGIAFHFFPTLYALPFLVNSLLPEQFSAWILMILQMGRERSGKHAKFPAHYSWCRGPMQSQIDRFEQLGYRIEEYIGFFGHDGYYAKLPILANAHRLLSNWLVRHPVPFLTSYAYITLATK